MASKTRRKRKPAASGRTRLLTFRPGRFDIPADEAMLARIEADAVSSGGSLAPGEHWQLDPQYKVSLQAMLDSLLGPIGMQPVDRDAVRCFEPFLRATDRLGLLDRNLLVQASAGRWTKSDLGTAMDLNLILGKFAGALPDRLSVCEVGGGYGRLAEAFLKLYPKGISYIMVDAVPATMMYAYEYLKASFPNRKIGSWYGGDVFGPDFDCYIMPAWRAASLPDETFDAAVNIESMQEMETHHIEHFLAMFDRVIKPQGTIYISNARDYVYQGPWPFPPAWETLFFHNTPRSWSRNHPTIVMQKDKGDHLAERQKLEDAFIQEIEQWHPGLATLRP